jgi:hypothetical protein
MSPIIILAILIFIFLISIAVCSFIINILNQISDSLKDSQYKSLTGDCADDLEKIKTAETAISLTRGITIIPLVISIIIVIAAIIGIILLVVGGGGGGIETTGSQSFIKRLVTTRLVYLILTFGVGLIFLAFSVVYIFVLANLNDVDTKCFSGPSTNPNSNLGKFENAKQVTLLQLITCVVMTVVFFGIGIFLIIIFKKASPKGYGKQQFNKEALALNKSFGKGVQNLEFTTDQVFESARNVPGNIQNFFNPNKYGNQQQLYENLYKSIGQIPPLYNQVYPQQQYGGQQQLYDNLYKSIEQIPQSSNQVYPQQQYAGKNQNISKQYNPPIVPLENYNNPPLPLVPLENYNNPPLVRLDNSIAPIRRRSL